jgi:hypothetical protein
VHTCLETIQTMVASQAELQSQVAKLQQALEQTLVQPSERSTPAVGSSGPSSSVKTPEELELEEIAQLMSDRNYEQATMKWLQSSRTTDLFDALFIRCNPTYIRQVSPLLALSTGAVVSQDLGRHTQERLIWLDAVLTSVDPHVSGSNLALLVNTNFDNRTVTFATSCLRSWT